MVHTLRLDNYFPTPRKLVLGTNSSFGTESIKIERGAGWDGLNLTATWHIPGREEPLRVALLDGDAMDVPPEVTKEAKDGVLVLAGLASGVQRASCNVEYLILEQAGVYGGADAEPTPELAAQVLEAALQAKADAEAAAEDAAAAKANAEKAQQAAENAAADAAKAGPYAEAARAAQEAAESARDEAIAAQQAAENAAAAAAASKSAADTLAAEAARAALAAENSKTAANNAAYFAGENATAAQQAADTATAVANDAGQSASDAAASKAAAETAAKAAQDAQTAAAAAKAEAVKAQEAAQTAAKSAQDAQAAAEKARDEAKAAQKGAEAARNAAAKSAEAAAKSEANAKQSADTLAESVENVVANTAAVAELKKKKAEIDDAAVGANAWSSKHIIDMLCPPLEESGNPVVCYPVAGYPLGVKASWEPVQEGSGTPSPENIRPIKGRDSVTVERCGENLLNIKLLRKSRKNNGITWTINDNGSVSVSGNSNAVSYLGEAVTKLDKSKMILLAPGTYYFGGSSATTSIYFYGYYEDGTLTKEDILSNKTKTIESNLWLTVQGRIMPGTSANETVYPIITFGTTAPTAYTPYTGQTNTLTLPETVYGGEVDAVTGEGKKTRKLVTLDGNSDVTTYRENDDTDTYKGFAVRDAVAAISTSISVICSHFKDGLASSQGYYPNTVLAHVNGNLYIRTEIPGVTSVETFKAYLAAQYAAGTPVQVCYTLAEPVPFTATGAQPIPALAGVNTVLTDADTLSVTAEKAPPVLLGELRKEYEATVGELETAQRDIRVLKKLSKGQVWDFEEKTEDAYVRQVPAGAYAAGVQTWGGKTVVWNNCFSANIVKPGVTVKNNKIVFTNSNPGTSFSVKKLDGAIPVGHKIYRAARYLQGKTGNCSYSGYGGYTIVDDNKPLWSGLFTIPSNSVFDGSQIESVIESVSNPVTNMWICMPEENAEIIEPVTVEIIFCDLTLMFGTGAEPTSTDDPRIAWIEQYAAAHQEYNEGELVSAGVDEVTEHGRNLLVLTTNGGTSHGVTFTKRNDGCFVLNGTSDDDIYFSISQISYPKGEYKLVGCPSGGGESSYKLGIFMDGVYFPSETGSGTQFSLQGKKRGPYTDRIEIGVKGGVTLKNVLFKPMLTHDLTTTYDDFVPYYAPVSHPIPSAVQELPGYGLSETAKNTVERTADGKWQYVQRVGKVELDGTERLNYYSPVERGLVATIICMPEAMPKEVIGFCSLYKFVKNSVWSGETENCVFFSGDKTLGLSIDLSTATSFGFDGTKDTIPKTVKAMLETYKSRGTPLSITYPLNTPIVTDITDLMGTDALNFEVEPGGSITMHNATELPVPATIQYVEKLSEVVSND